MRCFIVAEITAIPAQVMGAVPAMAAGPVMVGRSVPLVAVIDLLHVGSIWVVAVSDGCPLSWRLRAPFFME